MKEYMMVFLGADYGEGGLEMTPEQIEMRMGKWFAWGDKMAQKGIVAKGKALEGRSKRITGPDKVLTDGLALASKELIGGFYVIEANSMEEVIEIAQDFPDYDLGSTVEIREVTKFE